MIVLQTKLLLKYAETKPPIYENQDGILMSGGLTVEKNSQDGSDIIVRKDTVFKLNIITNEWKTFSDLKSVRTGHQSTIIGDKMYLVGGYNGLSRLADTEVIPISKNDKTLIPTIPTMHYKRSSFGMCSFSGCIFVAGGRYNKDEDLDKCEVYSTESCKWIEVSSMNTKRCAFPLIYFQDKIWAIGGHNGDDGIDIIETYNLTENNWTTVDTKLLSKRCYHSAVVNDNKYFVIGGVYDNKELSSVEVYSSETNQFSFISAMSVARSCFGCSIFNNNLIVFGGYLNESQATDSVEVYDIEKQVWSKGPNLPFPLTAFGYACNN